ncbi:hypothetical protein [Povalibacter sp.]|uniref:COG3650 family protein n=1 Tax=Povalibacter sp. TaxID=1962978 RepID=UPI002F408426
MSRCRILCLTGLSVMSALLACGCNPQSENASPSATAPAAPAGRIEFSGPLQEEASAESGLAIKRGIVTADGDHASYRACGDRADLWLLDEGEGALTQLLTEDLTSLYIEAYGERGPIPDNLTAAAGHAGVFLLEQLLYAAPTGENRGCERAPPDYVVTARGNEPFWAAEVTQTGMVWKQPDDPQEIRLGELQAEDVEGAVGYSARAAQHKVELQIEAQACRDSMSGEYFAYAARAVLDGREFKGCAHVGTQDAP